MQAPNVSSSPRPPSHSATSSSKPWQWPVVATACAGPQEILLHGRYGRIVAVGNELQLAHALKDALDDPGDPIDRRRRADEFSFDVRVPTYEALIRKILEEQGVVAEAPRCGRPGCQLRHARSRLAAHDEQSIFTTGPGFLDLTHVGRHVTGIERVAIEQFEKVAFDGAKLQPIKARGIASMILKQQIVLPLALIHPHARFVFPGFPPSPFFALLADRVTLYVHDTFLLTRRGYLSAKARLYMAPQFRLAVRWLRNFLVNSEKTAAELKQHVRREADIRLYRPTVANHFKLMLRTEAKARSHRR